MELDSAKGLKAKDELSKSSKKVSLLLSGASNIGVELLLLPFAMNENFPVVGDGCACGDRMFKGKI